MLSRHPLQDIDSFTAPIHFNEALKVWEIRSYAQVLAVLKDMCFIATGGNFLSQSNSLMGLDLGTQAAHRELINAFQREQKWVEQKTKEIVLAACEQVRERDRIDFYNDIILPSCRLLACELTCANIKLEEREELLQYALAVFHIGDLNDEWNSQDAMAKLSAYFLNKMEEARVSSNQDFISVLIQTNIAVHELLSPVIQLFTGLATSLPLLLSNALFALFTFPGEKQNYLNNPLQSVNELLRYAGPAQMVYRVAMEEINLGEHIIHRGEKVALFLSKANFDETQFSCPYHLDSNSNVGNHLSLGHGWHACIGAPLIRTALLIIPATILNYFPEAEINEEGLVWGGSKTIQGFIGLPENKQ